MRRLVWLSCLGLVVGAASGCSKPDAKKDEASAKSMKEKLEGIAPGEERDMGRGVKMLMHRMQATDPIAGGWHRATSTEGGFSVEVPLPFNDFRTTSKATDGVAIRGHAVGGKTPGLLSYAATCIARQDGKLGPKAPKAGTDKRETKGTPVKAHLRTITLADRSCVLVVEKQGTDPLPSEADRKRFLDSFKALGSPKW